MKIFVSITLAFTVLLGCAASNYQKAEKLYQNNQYQELVQSGVNCSDFSPECFQLKYYRTESYNILGDKNATLEASKEAIDRIGADTPLSKINYLYSLRTSLIREKLLSLKNETDRATTLRVLESDYREIISILMTRDMGENYQTEKTEYQIFLVESLLERMKLLSGRNLEILYDRILDLIRDFDPSLISEGYDKYTRCSSLRITNSGRFLFVLNRSHNSVACFIVDPITGILKMNQIIPTETIPRELGLDPDDKFLFVVGYENGRVASYRVLDDGKLRQLESRYIGKNPMWVLVTREEF